MKPEQRNQEEQAPMIYRELGRQLHLPEQRIRALEQQIRRKAAEQKTDSPVYMSGRKKKFRTENWLGYRFAPIAACAVLAVTGALFYRAGMMRNSEFETAESDYEVVIQSDLPEQTNLTTAADAVQTVTSVLTSQAEHAQTGTENPQTDAARQTDPPAQTAPPAVTDRPASATAAAQTTTEIRQTTPEPQTVSTTVTTEMPEEPPVMTEVVTAPPPTVILPEVPEAAIIALDDSIAHPGETVRAKVYFTRTAATDGFEVHLRVQSMADVPLPEVLSCSYPIQENSDVRISLLCFYDEKTDTYNAVFGESFESTIPAGTALMELELRIPENVPAGTVYEFYDPSLRAEAPKIISREYPDGIENAVYIGCIFVQ